MAIYSAVLKLYVDRQTDGCDEACRCIFGTVRCEHTIKKVREEKKFKLKVTPVVKVVLMHAVNVYSVLKCYR
jgi:hypothetical protein